MPQTAITALLLILTNVAFSWYGLSNRQFFDGYKFEVDPILIKKDYKRLITSGFLHVSWMHLLFNMISLYAFSELVESQLGVLKFLLIYFSSLVGGDLLALYVHRNHGDYSAAGASGAICGVIFASLALFPGLEMGFIGIPVAIPGWLFGIGYVLYSIYGIRSNRDNIGHEAHLGGALVGMAVAIFLEPSVVRENYLTILLITVPAVTFIYLIIAKPHILLIDNFYFSNHKKYHSVDHKYNDQKVSEEQEVDRILDKVFRKGVDSLTKKEKQILDEHSKKM